jgi:hypothetical protein
MDQMGLALITRTTAVLLIALSIVACARQKTFDEKYATAKENAATTPGIAYDNAVGAVMQSTSAFVLAQRECVVKNPGQASLRGYMLIKSPTDYTVVLEPRGALADCIEATFASYKLPTPPSSPYLNPLEFSTPP